MAIKKKEEKTPIQIPENIDKLLLKGFTEQFLRDKYGDMFDDTKKEVLSLIKDSEELEITQGEGFKCNQGSIIISERTSYKYDKDAIAELVENGTVTVQQLLECVSTFKNEDLIKTLSQKVFDKLATKNVSETFTFKATPDFKQKCEDQFSDSEVEKKEVEPETKPEKPKKTEKVSKAKEVAANALAAKLNPKSIDDDIDAILNGE